MTVQLRPSISLSFSGSYTSEDCVRIILRDKNVGDFAYSEAYIQCPEAYNIVGSKQVIVINFVN